MCRLLIYLDLAALLYGLYGILCGTLELSLPTFGYNYAIVFFVFLSCVICLLYSNYISKSAPFPIVLFFILGFFSTIINFREDGLISICCIIVPWIAYLIGSIITRLNHNKINGDGLGIIYWGLCFLLLICYRQLFLAPEILVFQKDFIFTVIFFVPFIFLLKKKEISIGLLTLVGILLVISLKRSAILALFIICIVYYVLHVYFNISLSRRSKFLRISGILILFLIIGIYLAISSNFEVLQNRMLMIEEDGGSGRDVIYANVYDKITNGDIIDIFFGHGFDNVQLDMGIPAHNELLEITYDYGIFMTITWILIILSLFYRGQKALKNHDVEVGSLLLSTLIFWQFISESNNVFVNVEYLALIFLFFGLLNKDYRNENHLS